MLNFPTGSLFDEAHAYRALLEAHVSMPLRIELAHTAEVAPDHQPVAGKLAAVTFKITLLDSFIDLARLYGASAGRTSTDWVTNTLRRAEPIEVERRLAFIPATHLLFATDNLRHRDRAIVPTDIVSLERRFGRFYATWVSTVAPALSDFSGAPSIAADMRLRAAVDDYVFRIVQALPGTRDPITPQPLAGGHAA